MSHNGPSWGRKSIEVKILEDQARRAQDEADTAQRAADRLKIKAWNRRMDLDGVAVPSPSIGMAVGCGYRFLRVRCKACSQCAWLNLAEVRRPRGTPVHLLEGALACKVCRDRGARAPRGTIERLTRDKTFGNDED
jgi:hypothetical protein